MRPLYARGRGPHYAGIITEKNPTLLRLFKLFLFIKNIMATSEAGTASSSYMYTLRVYSQSFKSLHL